MPTILLLLGWRLFFYANEGNEPIHIHCRKGDMECKFWLNTQTFDIEEAFSFNVTRSEKRVVRKIIFEHFEYIEEQWKIFQAGEMKKHVVEDIRFEMGSLLVRIDGAQKKFPLKAVSPLLAGASPRERDTFEVSPSGYGIHWPLLDEDLSIDALLGVVDEPSWHRKSA